MPVQRVTCFKFTDPANITSFQSQYEALSQNNSKDGQPYLLSMQSGPTMTASDARAQGYNFIALATFASDDDVRYYDEECPAHRRCKEFAQGKLEGPPLTVMLRV